jgi:ABC-2 type transport system ATP-binding protein
LNAPLTGDRDVLRHIGFTPDTPPMYDELTVRQYLRFIGMGYDLSAAETNERIDFWLEKVWLVEKAEQKIKQLSRGMRQRVAQFRQLLCSLREQGKALIVSSHILADMDGYCTHIGIMSAGQMVRMGTVAQFSQNMQSDRCRYTVVLARPFPQLAAVMAEVPLATQVQIEGERIVLEYPAGRESAAALLAALMKLGLPVAAFSDNTASLEEVYLRTQIRQVD